MLKVENDEKHADKHKEIDRISAVGLSHSDFMKYQNENKPVIITDLELWSSKKSDKVGIDRLNDIIVDNYLFDGIFVSKYKDHRYLYFKSNASDKDKNDKMYFKSMKWMDLYQQLKQQKNNDENIYLYGQPLPENVCNHIKSPSFLNKNKLKLYLWISNTWTCSHLHYDLNEGFLYQLYGSKKVTLISSKYYKSLYPYSRSSVHWRQSQIDNIDNPDSTKYPLFYNDGVIKYKGIINKNEGLYIPFSWWHQIESIYDENDNGDNGIISLSMPWNPYKSEMTQYLQEFVDSMNKKFEQCNDMKIASDDAQKLFDQQIKESDLPIFIKKVANIWKETCVVLDTNN